MRISFKKIYFLVFLISAFFVLSSSVLAATSQPEADGQPNNPEIGSLGENEPDAIAVRVIPNPDNYNVQQWYRMQGFAGSPQSIIVDGYKAIRDGRTVYISAANLDLDNNKLYFNIYLISYNQEADDNTIDIFGRILKNWKLNTNIKDRIGHCNISSKVCETNSDCASGYICGGSISQGNNSSNNDSSNIDSSNIDSSNIDSFYNQTNTNNLGFIYQKNRCVIGEDDYNSELINTPPCMLDSDCPASLFCDSLQSAVIRDMERLEKLTLIRSRLENYKSLNGHYPIISSGTYVPYVAVSSWPSWQSTFLSQIGASSVTDSINRIGSCYDSQADFDLVTCWEPNKAAFIDVNNPINSSNFILPNYSTVFSYVSDSNGENASIYSSMETNVYLGEDFELPSGETISDLNPPYMEDEGGDIPQYNSPYFTSASLDGHSGRMFEGSINAKDPRDKTLTWGISDCIPGAPLFPLGQIVTTCPSSSWSTWTPNKIPSRQFTNSNEKILLKAEKAGESLSINSPNELQEVKSYIVGAIIKNTSGFETRMNFPIYVTNRNPAVQSNSLYTHNLSSYQDFSFDIVVSDQSGLQGLTLCQLDTSNNCQASWNLLPGISRLVDLSGSSLFNGKLIIDFVKDAGGESYVIKIKNKNSPYTGNFNTSHLGDHKFRIVASDAYNARTQKDFVVRFTAENPQVVFNCSPSALLNSNYACVISSGKPSESISVNVYDKPSFLTYNASTKTLSGVASALGGYTIGATITNEFGKSANSEFDFNVYTTPTVMTNDPYQDYISSSGFTCTGSISSVGDNTTNGYKGCVVNTSSSALSILSSSACVSACNGSPGISIGSIISPIGGLTRNTKYYYRTFAINEAGTGYGTTKSFYTRADYPSLTMNPVIASASGLDLSANISNNGGATLVSRGFFWSTSSSVTAPPAICNLANKCWIQSSGSIGNYNTQIASTNFSGGTYYFRAFAINRDNNDVPGPRDSTGVSAPQVFTIPVPPSVSTNSASNVTYNSATSGGAISNPSSVAITECGVAYSSSNNSPTTANSKVSTTSCSGNFISNLTGLSQETLYYLRAYISSPLGTLYGETKSFTTFSPDSAGSDSSGTMTYVVSFNKNNASATGTMTSQSISSGATVSLKTNSFSLAGYAFDGWATSATGPVVYANQASYNAVANITLYAKWTADSSGSTVCSVTYSGNGNTGGSVPSPTVYDCGTNATLSANSGGLVKTDYAFNGWNTNSSGTGSHYVAGGTLTNISSAVTLYAEWVLAEAYPISFNSNGGTGTMTGQIFYHGVPQNLKANTFTRTGYTFAGWSKSPTGSLMYTDQASYTAIESQVLYAKWNANAYSLTFDSQGGTAVSSKNVTYGLAVGTLLVSTKTGYVFGGWYTAINGGGTLYTATTVYNVAGPTTLYAKWTANNTYTFTMNVTADPTVAGSKVSVLTSQGTTSCSAGQSCLVSNLPAGSSVTLTPTFGSANTVHWVNVGGCSSQVSCSLTLNSNLSSGANFYCYINGVLAACPDANAPQ